MHRVTRIDFAEKHVFPYLFAIPSALHAMVDMKSMYENELCCVPQPEGMHGSSPKNKAGIDSGYVSFPPDCDVVIFVHARAHR